MRPNPTVSLDVEDFAGTGDRRGVRQTRRRRSAPEPGRRARRKASGARRRRAGRSRARGLGLRGATHRALRPASATLSSTCWRRRSVCASRRTRSRSPARSRASRRDERGRASRLPPRRSARASRSTSRAPCASTREHELETARQALAALWAGSAALHAGPGRPDERPPASRRPKTLAAPDRGESERRALADRARAPRRGRASWPAAVASRTSS